MGPWRTLQTAHFIIHYPRSEEEAVAGAAAKLEPLYETMRRDNGLPLSAGAKIGIDVAGQKSSDSTLWVPAPLLLQAPIGMPDATLFLQSVRYQLMDVLQEQAIHQHEMPWQTRARRWQPLTDALRTWSLWNGDMGDMSSTDRRSMIVGPNDGTAQRPPTVAEKIAPTWTDHLCTLYQVWEFAPLAYCFLYPYPYSAQACHMPSW